MASSTTLLSFSNPMYLNKTPCSGHRSVLLRPISGALSQKPSPSKTTTLPMRDIPGDYGLPFIGPVEDRRDFIYRQGRVEFFKSRIQKYGSTVLRTNMPPGPFISPDPKVVALLDGKSFPILFDVSKVEKRDLFSGTFMPSTDLTGGYRVLSYLDPSEPNHTKLKNLIFFLLTHRRDHVIPEFHTAFSSLFGSLETELAAKGKAEFGALNEQASFNFLAGAFFGADPRKTQLGNDAPKLIGKWVLFQLGPILTLGLPMFVEELLLRTFPLPPFLVKSDYQRLYEFVYQVATPVLDEAEKLGIGRDEACHNLIFAICFNSFGGLKIFFPTLMKSIGQAGSTLQLQLAEEIRGAIASNAGKVSVRVLEQMPLMKSVVYEAFRLDPPVPFQYGKAKKDLVVESHDATFAVKKGEMLFGFQPFATRDPLIFDRGEEFVADRFMGEAGERLLKHVLWSNGPETESPTTADKQCAGKDFIILAARLFVVELFRRYDSFDIEVGQSTLGVDVTVTSLKRATF